MKPPFDSGQTTLTSRKNLQESKRELLRRALKQKGIQLKQDQRITPRPKTNPCLASFNQESLWFLDQLDPHQGTYNIPRAFHIQGPLQIQVLEQSLNDVVARHEALRTTFRLEQEGLFQFFSSELSLSLEFFDFKGLSPNAQREKVDQLIRQLASQPFDLTTGPLLRMSVLQLGPEEHIVVLVVHHIISDGWSMGIIQGELSARYEALLFKKEQTLSSLPIHFADFAVWQREKMQSQDFQKIQAYWEQQLDGDWPLLEIPTDFPRSGKPSSQGQRENFSLTPALSNSIRELSRTHGATEFMTLLAGLQTLLYRYTGQSDQIIGSPISGRERKEVEHIVGYFVNVLPLRSDFDPNMTFPEIIEKVKKTTGEAYTHQAIPKDWLLKKIRPNQESRPAELFRIMFMLQNDQTASLNLSSTQVRQMPVFKGHTMFDINWCMIQTPKGYQGWVDYRNDLYQSVTIERLITHFKNLLEEIVSNPQQRMRDMSLMTEKERHQILIDWNRTHTDTLTNVSIHQRFEEQVRRTPNAVAVVNDGKTRTYQELNDRANQLAHELQDLGVQPNTLVGVYVERSFDMIVALLGTLKAGGAYVPLDPFYPPERLAFMIQDSNMPVIVTHGLLPSHLEPLTNGISPSPKFINLDSFSRTQKKHAYSNPSSTATPQNLMYVIYTSGSTGKPKGVLITHRAVDNFLQAMHQELSWNEQDILFAVTSMSFDIAVLEVFGPLLTGACVHLAARETVMDGDLLREELQKSKATIMQATPVTWNLLIDGEWTGSPGLKALCGGETLSPALANTLLDKGVTLWNMYGPTETTVWSTIHRVTPGNGPVPIGRPIANTQLYVLDPHQQPVPIGVPGELYIGGEGLSLGYCQRTDLTNEKFIPHPFSDDPQARVYRTGDQVRYRIDGTLEFLGRLDRQVKLRGHRIELGEIENVLGQVPCVQTAIVVISENRNGLRHVVAYLHAPDGLETSHLDLRQFVKRQLPEYMVPSYFVLLQSWPLTPNGKVDRKRLPEPDWQGAKQEYVAPRTPVEEILLELWEQVLEVDSIGIHDNFFDLGGHSLLATKVFVRIQKTFQQALPLSLLFEAPTIAELASHLDT